MLSSVEVLAAPPFPWVNPQRSAVCVEAPGAPPRQIDRERALALAAALAGARVGGTFWGPPPSLPNGPYTLADDGANGWTPEPGCDPWAAIEAAEAVVAEPGSPIGTLAALAGRPVRTGSGQLWPDAVETARALFAAPNVRFRNPFTGQEWEPEEAIALLGLWRRQIDRNRAIGSVAGIAAWKRCAIERFLWAGGAPPGPERAVWPSRAEAEPGDWQIEDGFLRSIGLGAELRAPLSIAVDRSGIYYDPSRPSDLEMLLQHGRFDAPLTARAAALREAIVSARLAKYGARGVPVLLPQSAEGRTRILVPGQVEDDRSVQLGGGGIHTNAGLLRAVREAAPDAFLIYKPHPDVEAGLRAGGPSPAEADRLADMTARGASLESLLDQVDAVHTLTSLTGFEALLRGVPVTTYGAPFYAGWGLTEDRGKVPGRRTARRMLDELVAAALILYPRYMDPETGLPCPPEILVRRLSTASPSETLLTRARRWQGRARNALRRAG